MTTSTKARTAAALASAVVFGALTFGAGTALAADPTVDGVKSEIAALTCVTLDAGETKVKTDIGVLVGLGLTDADETTLNKLLADKVAALDCDSTTPTTTTTQPTTQAPSGPTVSSVLTLVARLDCDGYAAKRGRITDQSADLVGKASSADLGRIADALTKRDRALNYCLSSSPLNPTQDDGSVVPDGSQVVEVPQGSASTGA